ncbi:hypothetical protein [Actinophytocola oryzae]|uniref:Uncharacterized protein n=1 Tax=Actinophytocola oryzae TaxID=502181 RepID=A0A4R7W8A1_9PSEU|nr:hypothetical protein [Actinophytocola oryzae]TDV57927.1 hypothetical protein CLV71_101801 [Actinophytocola oryzae]
MGTFAAIAMGMLGRNIENMVSPVTDELSNAVPIIMIPTAPPNANRAIAVVPSATRTSSTHARSRGLRDTDAAANPTATGAGCVGMTPSNCRGWNR